MAFGFLKAPLRGASKVMNKVPGVNAVMNKAPGMAAGLRAGGFSPQTNQKPGLGPSPQMMNPQVQQAVGMAGGAIKNWMGGMPKQQNMSWIRDQVNQARPPMNQPQAPAPPVNQPAPQMQPDQPMGDMTDRGQISPAPQGQMLPYGYGGFSPKPYADFGMPGSRMPQIQNGGGGLGPSGGWLQQLMQQRQGGSPFGSLQQAPSNPYLMT